MGSDLLLDGIHSSYAQNNYGALLYALVRVMRPQAVVELGTFEGYSGIHIGAAMRDNAVPMSSLDLIDEWERYPYRNCTAAQARANFQRNGLHHLAEPALRFWQGDAIAEAARFRDGVIDLLHIDLSNDGDVLDRATVAWLPKLAPGATVVIEAGSRERDQVEWMVKYQKPSIRSWLGSAWVTGRFSFVTLQPFPSMTILRRLH